MFSEMRTTLAIADDVLDAARALATHEHRPLGDVVSDLMRKGLTRDVAEVRYRNGVPLLPVSNPKARVTMEIVNRLRDELP
jgi:hypothetical protein